MCARIRSRTLFNATTWPGSLVIMATGVNLTYTVFLFSEKCVVWQTTATGLMIHTLARSMRWEMTESDSGSYHGKAFLDLPQASVIFSPQNTLTHHPNFSGGAKGESQHGLHFALRSFAYCTPWRMMTMAHQLNWLTAKGAFVGASIPSLQEDVRITVVVKTHYGANTWRQISQNLGTDVL